MLDQTNTVNHATGITLNPVGKTLLMKLSGQLTSHHYRQLQQIIFDSTEKRLVRTLPLTCLHWKTSIQLAWSRLSMFYE